MSYILDALKKSEAEHDPAAAANLALSQHRNQPRQRLLAILVLAALVTNIAVLMWLFGPSEQVVTTAEPPQRPVVPQPLQQPAAPPPVRGEVDIANQPPAVEPANDPGSDLQPVTSAPTEPATLPIRARLSDLPAAVRSRFPGLAFSTHVYAQDPSLRAIVANGRRLVVGEAIDGVTVAEITEDGVVLAFENYLVEIPVVAQWQ